MVLQVSQIRDSISRAVETRTLSHGVIWKRRMPRLPVISGWLAEKCFEADPASEKDVYTIVIPPPNITDS